MPENREGRPALTNAEPAQSISTDIKAADSDLILDAEPVRCTRCRRRLRLPRSVARLMGDTCDRAERAGGVI